MRLPSRDQDTVGGEYTPGRQPLLPRDGRDRPSGRLRRRRLLLQLEGFVSRLTEAVTKHRPGRVRRPGARRAAVAVVVSNGGSPAVVLIRRKARSGDPWSGQMAFPGGFQAGDGEPLLDTARRETLEETGLDLGALGRFHGTLDDVSPRTRVLPPLVVRPHVFTVAGEPALTAGDEADAVLWVPVAELFDPVRRTEFSLDLPDGVRRFPGIAVGEHVVWGLTERILSQVAELAGP